MVSSPHPSSMTHIILLSLPLSVHSYTAFPIAFHVPASLSSSSSSCTSLLRLSQTKHYSLQTCNSWRVNQKLCMAINDNDDDDDVSSYETEVITDANFDISNNEDDDEEEEWLPDREKAKRRAEMQKQYANEVAPTETSSSFTSSTPYEQQQQQQTKKNSIYTDEEEELIAAMGGKSKTPLFKNGKTVSSSKREPGYLGDSTLKEISMDYSVPICYLADVLATWGVPVPIDVHSQLGDLITGEQAFAILEAIHTLDLGALNDRYCNEDLVTLCEEYDLELKDAFEFAVKEGWNLPFGVRTFLRVEQEEELLRALVDDAY